MKLASVIAGAGIVDNMEEFQKWGFQLEPGQPIKTAHELVMAIEEVLQSEDLVEEKVTDLEIVKTFLETQKQGVLHVEIGSESADFDIFYGLTALGEYVFPWKGEKITDELTNGFTYLLVDAKKIFFNITRELYFGERRAFILCTPSGYVCPA